MSRAYREVQASRVHPWVLEQKVYAEERREASEKTSDNQQRDNGQSHDSPQGYAKGKSVSIRERFSRLFRTMRQLPVYVWKQTRKLGTCFRGTDDYERGQTDDRTSLSTTSETVSICSDISDNEIDSNMFLKYDDFCVFKGYTSASLAGIMKKKSSKTDVCRHTAALDLTGDITFSGVSNQKSKGVTWGMKTVYYLTESKTTTAMDIFFTDDVKTESENNEDCTLVENRSDQTDQDSVDDLNKTESQSHSKQTQLIDPSLDTNDNDQQSHILACDLKEELSPNDSTLATAESVSDLQTDQIMTDILSDIIDSVLMTAKPVNAKVDHTVLETLSDNVSTMMTAESINDVQKIEVLGDAFSAKSTKSSASIDLNADMTLPNVSGHSDQTDFSTDYSISQNTPDDQTKNWISGSRNVTSSRSEPTLTSISTLNFRKKGDNETAGDYLSVTKELLVSKQTVPPGEKYGIKFLGGDFSGKGQMTLRSWSSLPDLNRTKLQVDKLGSLTTTQDIHQC